jgi:hypothetical protein
MVDAAFQRVQFFGFAGNPQTAGSRCTDFQLLDGLASSESVEIFKICDSEDQPPVDSGRGTSGTPAS